LLALVEIPGFFITNFEKVPFIRYKTIEGITMIGQLLDEKKCKYCSRFVENEQHDFCNVVCVQVYAMLMFKFDQDLVKDNFKEQGQAERLLELVIEQNSKVKK